MRTFVRVVVPAGRLRHEPVIDQANCRPVLNLCLGGPYDRQLYGGRPADLHDGEKLQDEQATDGHVREIRRQVFDAEDVADYLAGYVPIETQPA